MNTESQVLNVPIEDIIPNRFQPRLNFDESSLQELSSSIKEHGIIQPLVLRRVGDKYEIIAGERRYKASKMAGLTSVPAIISTLDDKASAEVAVVENIQRKDLTSIEEARSYKMLLDKGYLTQEELAKKMGLSQSAISNKLRLLSLSQNVQDALIQGKISERHARSLLQLSSMQEQDEWLNKIIEERLTVRDLDNKLKRITKPVTEAPVPQAQEVVTPQTQEVVTPQVQEVVAEPSPVQKEDVMPIEPVKEEISYEPVIKEQPRPMPNKFFNFLEDEEANMSTTEAPAVEEEIEMLDFLVPDSSKIDFTDAKKKVEDLVADLKNTYNVNLTLEENNNLKYTINIKKKEE